METFSVLLAFCVGNPQVTGRFPSQRPAMRSFDFLWVPEQTAEQTIETLVIWDAIGLMVTSPLCLLALFVGNCRWFTPTVGCSPVGYYLKEPEMRSLDVPLLLAWTNCHTVICQNRARNGLMLSALGQYRPALTQYGMLTGESMVN